MPEASGKIVPRIVNEFTDASSAETVPDFPPAVGAVNEISVGAKSNAPREPLTLMAPIFKGDGSDAPESFPPALANAPCSSCRGHPPRAASTPSVPSRSRFPGTPGRSARYHDMTSARPTLDELRCTSGRNPCAQSNSPAPCRCEFRISTRNIGTRVWASPRRHAASKERLTAGSVPRPGSLHPWSPVRRASPDIDHCAPPAPAESLELEMVGAIRALTSTASSPRTPKSDSRASLSASASETFSQVRLNSAG